MNGGKHQESQRFILPHVQKYLNEFAVCGRSWLNSREPVSFQPNTDGEHVISLQKKEGEKWKLFYEFAKIMTT